MGRRAAGGGRAADRGDAIARTAWPVPAAGGDSCRPRRGSDSCHTDWPQVLKLYDLLHALAPSPVVTLNRAVAVAMVDGPRAGLASLDVLSGDRRLASQHRLESVRAHLHEMAGDMQAAVAGYEDAARRTTSIPEQRYLRAQAERLRVDVENTPTAPTIG